MILLDIKMIGEILINILLNIKLMDMFLKIN